MLIPLDVRKDQFDTWKKENQELIANLSINNPNYELAAKDLAEEIFSRNEDVNAKFAHGGFSLVSKQGILTAYSSVDPIFGKYMVKEHLRRVRFFEVALVLREFISEFAACRQQEEDVADFLFYLGRPLMTEALNLPNTFTGAHVWELLSKELGFRISLETLDQHLLDEMEKKTQYILKITQEDYHAMDFADKVSAQLRRFHRNALEKAYDRHKVVFWIVSSVVALGGALVRIFF